MSTSAVTKYAGEYGGQHWQSLYPYLYRVQYGTRIGGRAYSVDKVISAADEHHARSRCRTDFGSIDVSLVHTLERVS